MPLNKPNKIKITFYFDDNHNEHKGQKNKKQNKDNALSKNNNIQETYWSVCLIKKI